MALVALRCRPEQARCGRADLDPAVDDVPGPAAAEPERGVDDVGDEGKRQRGEQDARSTPQFARPGH